MIRIESQRISQRDANKEKIVISKKNVKEHKTTKERLLEFYGVDFNKKCRPQKEIDWGSPTGKEVW